jgi:hypothetical protein
MEPIDETSVKNEVVNPSKVLLVCVLGNQFSENFLRSWTEFIGYCLTHNIRPVLANVCESSFFIHKNHCLMCDMSKGPSQVPLKGEMEYDYVLWLSSSCLLQSSQHLERLMEMDKDVVSPSFVSSHSVNHMNFIQEVEFDKDQSYSFESREDVEKMTKDNVEDVKVDYLEMKCTLMKKGVLEKIQYPWFSGDQTNLTGEVFFCRKCKEEEIDIYVDLKNPLKVETKVIV